MRQIATRVANLLLGLLLVLFVYLIDRELANAARHATHQNGEAGASDGTASPHFQRVLHHKEGKMRKSFMWYINMALLIVFLAMLSCSIGCTPQVSPASSGRNLASPEPEVVVMPIVQNNLDFLYYAIAERGGLEASFCMLGKAYKETALVSRVIPVWVDSADEANLIHRPKTCTDSTTIGIVHFHPGIGYCALSDVDVISAHYLPWPTTAIVCRDSAEAYPRLMLVFRKDFDSAYKALPKDTTKKGPIRTFTATYRYRRPP